MKFITLIGTALTVVLLFSLLRQTVAYAQTFAISDVIPYDDSVRGYTVDNRPLKYKVRMRGIM